MTADCQRRRCSAFQKPAMRAIRKPSRNSVRYWAWLYQSSTSAWVDSNRPTSNSRAAASSSAGKISTPGPESKGASQAPTRGSTRGASFSNDQSTTV